MGTVTTGFRLGGLEEAVEPLQDAVCDLAFEPTQDAVPVIHDRVGYLDRRRQAAGFGFLYPGLQESGTLMPILEREDVLKGQRNHQPFHLGR